jgi:DNA gyrase subunit B
VSAPTLQARSDGEFEPDAYTARHLLVLEGLEAVRKRPGMYIGSTDSRGLMHCVWEIIDNAVDEALAGFCTRIAVVLHRDGSVEVGDDGRGIPVDVEPRTGLSGVEVVMTKLHAGGKFGSGSYRASGGLHGVGASVVNALSARLDVAVDRGGRTHVMSFRRGVPGEFSVDGPQGSFVARVGSSRRRQGQETVTGTRVDYWPNRQIFIREATVSRDELHNRARQTAFLVAGLTITVRDVAGRRPGGAGVPLRRGHQRVLRVPRPDQPVSDVLRSGLGPLHRDRADARRPGHMTPTEVERDLAVDVAVRWGTGTTRSSAPSSTSSRRRRAAPILAGFERALTKPSTTRCAHARPQEAAPTLLKETS